MAALEARSLQTRETILSPNALYPLGVGAIIGMVGAITSEQWAASDWNRWAAYVGIRINDQ